MSIGDLNHFVISAVVLTLTAGIVEASLIMRWPGTIEPGSTNSQITAIIDLLPTFCAIAGVDPPGDRVIDGRNILPYMKGEKVKKPIHESFIVPDSVIRHGHWKLLIRGLKPGGKSGREGKRPSAPAGSLFNLQATPARRETSQSIIPKLWPTCDAGWTPRSGNSKLTVGRSDD